MFKIIIMPNFLVLLQALRKKALTNIHPPEKPFRTKNNFWFGFALFPVDHEIALEVKEQDAEVVRQHERM